MRDNCQKPKFELDLHIPMMYLYMQFELYTYIQTKVRESKILKKIQEG
jgi:hypothetical protein